MCTPHTGSLNRVDDAIAILRNCAASDGSVGKLAGLLAQQGRADEAREVLRIHVENGELAAAHQLADLLAEQGHGDEAINAFCDLAEAGSEYAARRLADLLFEASRANEATAVLRARADVGDSFAAERLVDLLAEQGDVDGLQAEVHAGTHGAVKRLEEVRT
jgi:predicted negative regulator of RcsB-dependent stress response